MNFRKLSARSLVKKQILEILANLDLEDQQNIEEIRVVHGATDNEIFGVELLFHLGVNNPIPGGHTYKPGLPDNPVSRSLFDTITPKQIGMIKAVAREKGIDQELRCKTKYTCNVSELSKRDASHFIQWLLEQPEKVQPIWQNSTTNDVVHPQYLDEDEARDKKDWATLKEIKKKQYKDIPDFDERSPDNEYLENEEEDAF